MCILSNVLKKHKDVELGKAGAIVVVRSLSASPEVLMHCDIRGVTCRTFLRTFMWMSSLGCVVFTGHLCCLQPLSCTHPWRLIGGHYGLFTIPESISSRWACMMTWNGPWYCPELRRVKTAFISAQASIKRGAAFTLGSFKDLQRTVKAWMWR